jgi:uncharacterized protein YpmB
MKKITLLIIAGLFVACAAVSALLFSLAETQFEETTVTFNEELLVESVQVQAIHVDGVATPVVFFENEFDEIKVTYVGSCTYTHLPETSVEDIKDTLIVFDEFSGVLSVGFTQESFNFRVFESDCTDEIMVGVPANKIVNLDIDVISGDVEAPVTNFNTVSIDTISGNIALAQVNKGTFDTISGDVELFSLEEGSIDTVSGDIKITTAVPVRFDSVSGQLLGSVASSDARISIDTISGNARIG